MLEIKECKDILRYSDIINDLLDDYALVSVAEAYDGERVSGFGVYSYEKDAVVIHRVEYGDDLYLADGIVRTILFKAMMNGIDRGVFAANESNDILTSKLKYIKDKGRIINSITDFMDNCKNCKECN